MADGSVSQEIYNNCINPAGPGGGVPTNFTGGVVTAEVVTGGGLGVLEPETSVATVVGLVISPPNSGLDFAMDYYEIEIENEVTNLGAGGILLACYTSENFPADPICNQFDRDPINNGIIEVRDSFINIANQKNRGMDFTIRYGLDTPVGYLTLDSQATLTLENNTALFAGLTSDPLGEVGNPEWVGNINATLERGPWTAFWGYDWIGSQDNTLDYQEANGTTFLTIDGRRTQLKTDVGHWGVHSASLQYEFDDWRVLAGVSNLFDERPPQASSRAVGATLGNHVFSSQYTEGLYGRRG